MKRILTIAIFLVFSLTMPLCADTVTDEDYIAYQVEIQAALYQYAQEPEKMKAEIESIQKKYQPYSPEWRAYMETLHKEPQKALQLGDRVRQELEKQGIGWGIPRK